MISNIDPYTMFVMFVGLRSMAFGDMRPRTGRPFVFDYNFFVLILKKNNFLPNAIKSQENQ